MTKITLDRETFKALASDTRLDILKTLDGKQLGLNEIAKASNLNKATLHEHLAKLHEAGLIKRNEREGHKWVYYKLTWKGSSLLHPENTRIVVLFTTTFIALWVGVIQLIWYVKGSLVPISSHLSGGGELKVASPNGLLGSSGIFPDSSRVAGIPGFFEDFLMKARLLNDSGVRLGDTGAVVENGSELSMLSENGGLYLIDGAQGMIHAVYQDPFLLYIAVACFMVFTVVLSVSFWRLWENRTPKL